MFEVNCYSFTHSIHEKFDSYIDAHEFYEKEIKNDKWIRVFFTQILKEYNGMDEVN